MVQSSINDAIDEAYERLSKSYLWAERYDKHPNLQLAFPNGYIPRIDEKGRTISLAVVPDDGSHVDELVEKAGIDRDAYEAAIVRGANTLLRNEPIQKSLRLFLAGVLIADCPKPPEKKRGPKPAEEGHSLRYQAINMEVARLVKMGFSASRSEASTHEESACDIVARAMIKLRKRPQSYAQILEIWRKYPRFF